MPGCVCTSIISTRISLILTSCVLNTYHWLPLCLFVCCIWHASVWAKRKVALTFPKQVAEVWFKAAGALLTACLLQLSASWGNFDTCNLTCYGSQPISSGRVHTTQKKQKEKKVTTWPLTWIKTGIISLIFTLSMFYLCGEKLICQSKTIFGLSIFINVLQK